MWTWYSVHKRTLPWRDLTVKNDTQRAYQVMVSEIMLQQTQVPRVIIKYKEFLGLFPTLGDLAKASNKDVIMAWRGLGYNNRTLRLRDAAKAIGKAFPIDMNDLQALPGVGHYTAAAIRNFAFNLPTPCLDTNIRRILHRSFYGPEKADGTWPKSDKKLLALAEDLLTEALKTGTAADWHAALMDYGSLVCTRSNPKWDVCPLTQKGLMKAAYKTPKKITLKKKEPGRLVGSTFVPNRIFRGRVIEELRDEGSGLSVTDIGKRVCIDWNAAAHKVWLQGIIKSLVRDQLVEEKGRKLVLVE